MEIVQEILHYCYRTTHYFETDCSDNLDFWFLILVVKKTSRDVNEDRGHLLN